MIKSFYMNKTLPLNIIKFCPKCGYNEFILKEIGSFNCNSCGFEFFLNVASAVAALIEDDKGRLLLTIRAHEPKKGFLDLPGGFVSKHETGENALKREIKEELGLDISDIKYLVSFPNIYPYSGLTYYTLDLAFTCKKSSKSEITCDDDVEDYVFLGKENIDFEKIGFDSVKNIIQYWLESKSK